MVERLVATAFLILLGFLLLFVDYTFTSLAWADFPNLKFFFNLFTYQVDHANFSHFLGNWLFMAPYALFLEWKLGSKRFLAFYFLVGILSAFIFWTSSPQSFGMIGSSGSAFGVFSAACLAFNKRRWQRLAGFISLSTVVYVEFLAALAQVPGDQVARWGHLGGAAAGILLAFYLLPRPELEPKKH